VKEETQHVKFGAVSCILLLYFKAAIDQNPQGACECNGQIPQDYGRNKKL